MPKHIAAQDQYLPSSQVPCVVLGVPGFACWLLERDVVTYAVMPPPLPTPPPLFLLLAPQPGAPSPTPGTLHHVLWPCSAVPHVPTCHIDECH